MFYLYEWRGKWIALGWMRAWDACEYLKNSWGKANYYAIYSLDGKTFVNPPFMTALDARAAMCFGLTVAQAPVVGWTQTFGSC